MKDDTIRSIDNLINNIETIRSTNRKGDVVEHLWYRGQGNCTWRLIPSIQRTDLSEEEERHLANDFYICASHIMGDVPERGNYPYWIALMQHYGLPTRVLDWSQSPLVALYFALKPVVDADACIWVLRPGALNARMGDKSLHPIDSKTVQRMLQSAFIGHEDSEIPSILACYSVGNDRRMYVQQSCFTVHHSRDVDLEELEQESIVHRLVIPKENKKILYQQLSILGIRQSTLFPDLDHISHDLKQMYAI